MNPDATANAVQRKLEITAVLFFIVNGISVSSACHANAEYCRGFQEPSLTYVAYVEAVSRNNWELAYSYITPSVRSKLYRDLVFGLIVASSFDDELDRDIQPILSDNGFTIDSNGKYIKLEEDLDSINNWPKLMEELSVYLSKNLGYTFVSKDNILTNVSIQGKRASGSLKTRDSSELKTVTFTKTESGWCLGNQD